MNGQEIKSLAYHEAGHAVMYCLQKRKFTFVTIIPGKVDNINVDGYVTEKSARARPGTWANIDKELLINQAGAICEFYRDNSWKQHIYETQTYDMMGCLNLLKPHIKNETLRIKYMSYSYSHCVALLKQPLNMAYVKAVAEVLENEKTLTWTQVRLIMKVTRIEMDESFGLDRQEHDRRIKKAWKDMLVAGKKKVGA